MENAIVIIVLLSIVGGIVFYLMRAKMRGQKCVGCPYTKQCSKKCNCNENKLTDK